MIQSYPKERFEVIVVNNRSEDDILSVVEGCDGFHYEYEDKRSSYAARNRGIRTAKGEIIAFTDSDCIPDRDWIANGVKAITERPHCGMVGGKIRFFFKDQRSPSSIELFDSVFHLQQQNNIETNNYATTANMFTFNHIFDEIGHFNESLTSGGDMEWGKRVHAGGFLLSYADDVCVNHPARYSITQLHEKAMRVVGGRYDMMDGSNKEFMKYIMILLIGPFYYLLKFIPDRRLKSVMSKIKVFFILLLFKYMQIFEMLRLKFRLR
jgi:glycosyltransferase involved in cell wall biosynthesis